MTKLPPRLKDILPIAKRHHSPDRLDLGTQEPMSEEHGQDVSVPNYLREVYHWAYLSPLGRALFDHPLVVHTILFGNMQRLINVVLKELEPGERVLQPACVYGDFSCQLSHRLGENGHLTVSDVASIQVENARRKLRDKKNADVVLANAAQPPEGPFDKVVCFFLIHEVPDDYKRRIVEALSGVLSRDGEIIFVDYHRPAAWHPLRPIMHIVFSRLEPFAKTLWNIEITGLFGDRNRIDCRKSTYFGGLYQKVVIRFKEQ